MTERLVSLQTVKDWLNITNANSDKGLTKVIDAASQFIINYLNRDGLGGADYTQNFKGNGKSTTLLRNWPVVSVSAVGVNGSSIGASPISDTGLAGSGFVVGDLRSGPQSLELFGHGFYYGAQCQVRYRAGFETTMPFVIEGSTDDPSVALPFTPGLGGVWTVDQGIVGGDGTVFTLVTTEPALAGTYAVDEWGVYTFADVDIGRAAVVKYSFCPFDLSQAALDTISLWFRRKDRIGVLSKTLAGQETVTFDASSIPDSCSGILQFYTNVVPV